MFCLYSAIEITLKMVIIYGMTLHILHKLSLMLCLCSEMEITQKLTVIFAVTFYMYLLFPRGAQSCRKFACFCGTQCVCVVVTRRIFSLFINLFIFAISFSSSIYFGFLFKTYYRTPVTK